MPCAALPLPTLVTLVLHCHPDGLIFLSQPCLLLSLAQVVWWFRLINVGTHLVRINKPFEVLTPSCFASRNSKILALPPLCLCLPVSPSLMLFCLSPYAPAVFFYVCFFLLLLVNIGIFWRHLSQNIVKMPVKDDRTNSKGRNFNCMASSMLCWFMKFCWPFQKH